MIILYINTVSSIILFIIGLYMLKTLNITLKSPIYFNINRTFWYKIPYSITLMYRTTKHSSIGIFTIPMRNYLKCKRKDNMLFQQQKYEKQ